METLKTAVVVVLLLAVLYGAYVVLNKPEAQMPDDVAAYDENLGGPPQIDMGAAIAGGAGFGAPAGLPGPSISPGPSAGNGYSMPVGASPHGFTSEAGQYAAPQQDAYTERGASTADHDAGMRDTQAYGSASSGGGYGGDYTYGGGPSSGHSGYDVSSPNDSSSYGAAGGAEARVEPPYGGQYSGGQYSAGPDAGGEYAGTAARVGGYQQPGGGYGAGTRYEQETRRDEAHADTSLGSADAAVEAEEELPEGVQRNPYVKRGGSSSDAGRQSLGAYNFQRAWTDAQDMIERQQWREALSSLSVFYNSPDLTSEQHEALLELLDPLAGKVVYSREHLLTDGYVVRRGDTLADVAQRYNVPMRLLQKINGVQNPNVLTPGDALKVIPGPFSADVDLARNELTLFIDGLYAGRFPITIGRDPAPREGSYQVRGKQPGKPYFGRDGRSLDAADPSNPYGRTWIDLGSQMCIHGSQQAQSLDDAALGCISLSPGDAEDVYDILSFNSQVTIRR